MKTIRACLLLLLICAAIAAPAWCAPLEAYGQLPGYDKPALSPDGSKLAYVAPSGNRHDVVVRTLGAEQGAIRLDGGTQPVAELTWMGNDYLAITSTDARDGDLNRRFDSGSTWIYRLSSRELLPLRQWLGSEFATSVLTEPPQMRVVNGRAYAYLLTWIKTRAGRPWYGDGPLSKGLLSAVPALFRVDLDHAQGEMLQLGPRSGTLDGVLLDAAGEPVAETSIGTNRNSWAVEIRSGGHWRKPVEQDGGWLGPGHFLGLAAEDGWALMRMADGSVRRLSLRDGSWGAADAARQDTAAFLTDPTTHRIVGEERIVPVRQYRFYDPAAQAAWDKIAQAFPGEDLELVSWSDDRRKIVVRVFGEKTGAAYALADPAADHVELIGNEYPGIGPADVAPVQSITYTAGDGLSLQAYLTLPRDRPPSGLSLVVLPHDGPAESNIPGFDWWAQALASRGYAVLQPNFRGSADSGGKLLEAGFGQLGRKMQSDLADAVHDLVSKGIADPQRVCIAGAGYGGYAALAGAFFDNSTYRCAAAFAGISDLRQILLDRQTGGSWLNDLYFWHTRPKAGPDDYQVRQLIPFLGSASPDDPNAVLLSPASHPDKVSIPLLLIDSKDDSVVSSGQTRRMAEALKKAGKPYELLELPGDDHWLSLAGTRTQMLAALLQFLEKNDPPQQRALIEARRETRRSLFHPS